MEASSFNVASSFVLASLRFLRCKTKKIAMMMSAIPKTGAATAGAMVLAFEDFDNDADVSDGVGVITTVTF